MAGLLLLPFLLRLLAVRLLGAHEFVVAVRACRLHHFSVGGTGHLLHNLSTSIPPYRLEGKVWVLALHLTQFEHKFSLV